MIYSVTDGLVLLSLDRLIFKHTFQCIDLWWAVISPYFLACCCLCSSNKGTVYRVTSFLENLEMSWILQLSGISILSGYCQGNVREFYIAWWV